VSRYFTRKRPTQWIADDLGPEYAPMIPSLSVSEHEATDTGLLDADGNTIWREPNPMGFVWSDGQ